MVLHDADIREPLFDFLEEKYNKVRILEEKTIGRSRADVVMITPDSICGLEIKSDADSYSRLSRQIKDYDNYYDYNYVVVGTSHAHHIKEHVPTYWGIITVELIDNIFDFYILRDAAANPKCKLDKKMDILWKSELATIQNFHNMPKYRDKSKGFIIKKIIERTSYPESKKGFINISQLQLQICDVLFERDYSI